MHHGQRRRECYSSSTSVFVGLIKLIANLFLYCHAPTQLQAAEKEIMKYRMIIRRTNYFPGHDWRHVFNASYVERDRGCTASERSFWLPAKLDSGCSSAALLQNCHMMQFQWLAVCVRVAVQSNVPSNH